MKEIKIGDITIKQKTDGASNRVITVFTIKDAKGFLSSGFFESDLSGKDLSFQLTAIGQALLEMGSHAIGKAVE